LGAEECAELMDSLVPDAALDLALRERITVASAGNPLYVEEMLAMVREHGGDGDIVVPPTIHALLQARIDSLDGDVRVVMERGSVEGEVFHRGAVSELSPALVRGDVGSHLTTLVRKELIRSTSSTFPQDEGYRFRHLLIRDAAYESLPKATRAELHEQFAGWLSTHNLVEGDEIVGYHLEQAHRYRSELDGSDPALPELARRASDHLVTAGRGALDRSDFNAGRSLFRRATGLLPRGDEQRLALAPDYALALFEAGEGDEAWELLAESLDASDPLTRAHALVTRSYWGVAGRADQRQREAWREEALEIFEQSDDNYGIAFYWWCVAIDAWFHLRATETAEACKRVLAHLERSSTMGWGVGNPRGRLLSAYLHGPMPVDDAIEEVRAVRAGEHGLLEEAWGRQNLGRLCSLKGDIARARELVGARHVYLEAGLLASAGAMTLGESEVEFRAGDFRAEERVLREGIEILERIGERGYYPTVVVCLAECLYRAGAASAEIEELCDKARDSSGGDDLVNFVWLDMLGGLLHARRGEHEQAEQCARQALTLAESTDFYFARAATRTYFAEILVQMGRSEEAAEMAAQAFEILEAKGDIAAAAQFRSRLVSLGVEVS
jgi:tetratricopeptide (TPR) repeat protein